MDNRRDEKTADVCRPGCWCSSVRKDAERKNVSFVDANAAAPPSACPSGAREPQSTKNRYCCRSAKNEIESEASKTTDRPANRCQPSPWICEFLKRQPAPEWTVKAAAQCADRRTAKIRSKPCGCTRGVSTGNDGPPAPTTITEPSAAADCGDRSGGFDRRVSNESICGFLKNQPTPEWIVRDRQSGTDCHASGAREPPARRCKYVADNSTAGRRNPGADCNKPTPPPPPPKPAPPPSCGCGSRQQRNDRSGPLCASVKQQRATRCAGDKRTAKS